MLFFSLLAIVSAALVSANPAKRVDNRQYINLKVSYGYNGQDLCVGPSSSGDINYLAGTTCGTTDSKLIALYGVGKSGPLEVNNGSIACPTSVGADLTGASSVHIVGCDVDDKSQFWTIQENGSVTNDETGTCLTMAKKAPGVPLTLRACDPSGPNAKAQLFYYDIVSA